MEKQVGESGSSESGREEGDDFLPYLCNKLGPGLAGYF